MKDSKDLIFVVSDEPRSLDKMVKCLESTTEDKFLVRGARFSMFETVLPSMGDRERKIRLVVFNVGSNSLRSVSEIVQKMGRDQRVIMIHHDRGAIQRLFSLFCKEAHQPRGEHIFSTDLFFDRSFVKLVEKSLGLDQPKADEAFVAESGSAYA